ncbi:hypothetical protein ITJ58_16130 [Curtobacterium flaccumfaciens]|uniref:hypothetical protein n=1 Tax=Curtobacterium flaccumfaciens TaxID=2035 RepID=UPI00188D30EB|nr:hypothetical protein [Curtobacterium flaccumfaciens]MBF4595293.1 hypothetical protein [Curtobacterium flaccumfaciens]
MPVTPGESGTDQPSVAETNERRESRIRALDARATDAVRRVRRATLQGSLVGRH